MATGQWHGGSDLLPDSSGKKDQEAVNGVDASVFWIRRGLGDAGQVHFPFLLSFLIAFLTCLGMIMTIGVCVSSVT